MIRVVSDFLAHETSSSIAPNDEEPASAPTVFFDLTTGSASTPTALPAPPLMPDFEPRLAEASIPRGIPQRKRPVLEIIATLQQDPSARVTKRMATGTKLRLVREMSPSTPPSLPPPGSAPVRRAA